jgi:two-component system alkaline phosphatase synthesis response regulator PhoP
MATKILIVDDDPAVHDILGIHLRAKGYVTEHAFGGGEGVEKAKDVRPDIILLDFEMPDAMGEEVFNKLREHEAMKDIPVCFLSSLKLANQVGRVPVSRNVRFCHKPIEVPKLLEVIEEFLGQSS